MERAIETMAKYSLASEAGRAADQEFHATLLSASDNPFLESLTSGIGAAVARTTLFKQRHQPLARDPVPDHMRYIAKSAVGPGAEVSYSVDGGHSFGQAEDLKVPGVDGRLRPAVAADYTHIRWQLKNSLRANSVAFVRFRALVK